MTDEQNQNQRKQILRKHKEDINLKKYKIGAITQKKRL